LEVGIVSVPLGCPRQESRMTTEIVIRRAVPDERQALEDLQRRASLVYEEYREALLAHPDAIELPLEQIENAWTYVAELAGEISGFSVVLPRPDGDAELDGLFVEPTLWRRGIARCLMQRAEKRAASEGAKSIHVIANPKARDFYTACGFELIGEAQTRFGAGLAMLKRLA
jgi:GNAT superfamily N-acetyltransferase